MAHSLASVDRHATRDVALAALAFISAHPSHVTAHPRKNLNYETAWDIFPILATGSAILENIPGLGRRTEGKEELIPLALLG